MIGIWISYIIKLVFQLYALIHHLYSIVSTLQVRSDCVLLAGSFLLREQEGDRSMLLEDLHAERKKLQRKVRNSLN